jgi:hypothetical protein
MYQLGGVRDLWLCYRRIGCPWTVGAIHGRTVWIVTHHCVGVRYRQKETMADDNVIAVRGIHVVLDPINVLRLGCFVDVRCNRLGVT